MALLILLEVELFLEIWLGWHLAKTMAEQTKTGSTMAGMTVPLIEIESNSAERTAHLRTKAMHLAQMTADQTKTGSTMAGMTVRLIEMESKSAERTAHLTTKAMHLAQMTAD